MTHSELQQLDLWPGDPVIFRLTTGTYHGIFNVYIGYLGCAKDSIRIDNIWMLKPALEWAAIQAIPFNHTFDIEDIKSIKKEKNMKSNKIEIIVKGGKEDRETALLGLILDANNDELRVVLRKVYETNINRFKTIVGGCHGIMYTELDMVG